MPPGSHQRYLLNDASWVDETQLLSFREREILQICLPLTHALCRGNLATAVTLADLRSEEWTNPNYAWLGPSPPFRKLTLFELSH